MIVVTGGAGFIGSNIVAALDEADFDVVVCDRLHSDGKWRNLAKRSLRAFIEPTKLEPFLDHHRAEIEAIVHMGAISVTTVTDGDLVIQNNFELSRYLWDWCCENDSRLIYASSAATYGDGSRGFKDDWGTESLKSLRPLNLYGWSKHLFDQFVARSVDRKRATPLQFAGLKFFNVYGPNEAHKGSMKSVVAHLFPKVSTGAAAQLFRSYHPDYEDGGQLRDFVYVRDCVDIVLWLIHNPDVNGIMNVGTGSSRSFADLASATMRAIGREPEFEYVEMPETLRSKYQYYTQADICQLRNNGYHAPMTSLEDGVSHYVSNFLSSVEDTYR